MMAKIYAVMLAVAFTLGVAGLGFSEEAKSMASMKHAETKVCGNTNCCGGQTDVKKDVDKKKADEDEWKDFNEKVRGG